MAKTSFNRGDTAVTIGKGKLYFNQDDTNGFEDFLEVNNFKYNIATELLELNSSRYGVVTPLTPITKSIKLTGSFVCISPLLELQKFFGLAKSVDDASQSSGSLSWAAYTARLGKLIKLGYYNLSSVKVRKATGQTFTADAGTDVISATAHGFEDGDPVYVQSTTTLPAGLSANTIYYVRDKTTDSFKLAATSGGAAIDITSTGSGTHSVYRAYIEGTDFEIHPGDLLHALLDGAITDGLSIAVSASYPDNDAVQMDLAEVTEFKGNVLFVSDAQVGVKEMFEAYVKLYPTGDKQFIGDDAMQFEVQFTAIKDTSKSGITGLARVTDLSGKSHVVAAA